jgi:hypothetical protein
MKIYIWFFSWALSFKNDCVWYSVLILLKSIPQGSAYISLTLLRLALSIELAGDLASNIWIQMNFHISYLFFTFYFVKLQYLFKFLFLFIFFFPIESFPSLVKKTSEWSLVLRCLHIKFKSLIFDSL